MQALGGADANLARVKGRTYFAKLPLRLNESGTMDPAVISSRAANRFNFKDERTAGV